jgi:hypothetical protein
MDETRIVSENARTSAKTPRKERRKEEGKDRDTNHTVFKIRVE